MEFQTGCFLHQAPQHYIQLLGTDANGCSASDTVSIGVWNLPLVDAGADQDRFVQEIR